MAGEDFWHQHEWKDIFEHLMRHYDNPSDSEFIFHDWYFGWRFNRTCPLIVSAFQIERGENRLASFLSGEVKSHW
jgi:hypothetical protein